MKMRAAWFSFYFMNKQIALEKLIEISIPNLYLNLLMFVFIFTFSHFLIRYHDLYLPTITYQQTLATQSWIWLWIPAPGNKMFFPDTHFFQEFFAIQKINVTGTTGTYASAIMLQIYIMFQADLQDSLAIFDISQGYRFCFILLKIDLYRKHL